MFFIMLRSGYTTGACAAAASKAAVLFLLDSQLRESIIIPFPDGSRVSFTLFSLSTLQPGQVKASVIKDAGDDPDVTNRAELIAIASFKNSGDIKLSPNIFLSGGKGVGQVTKPGLAVNIGEPAINPVPRDMILKAIKEALDTYGSKKSIHVEIRVKAGEEIAKKTLNSRLGIIGGISILGTTGIVKPISAKAWKETVKTSMNVAQKLGIEEIAVSTGRTSEAALQDILDIPDESYVEMGDYLEFTLKQANEFGFKKIYYGGMWAKILKGAMGWKNTHVRNGALEIVDVLRYFKQLGIEEDVLHLLEESNSARDIYEKLLRHNLNHIIKQVCLMAKMEFEQFASLPVEVHLVDANKQIQFTC